MQIPSLPTDNLYKFITVFGIVLFITVSIYKERAKEELLLEIVKLENKTSTIQKEVKLQTVRKASFLYKEYLNIIKNKNLDREYSFKDFYDCVLNAYNNSDSIKYCHLEDTVFKNVETIFKYDSLGMDLYFKAQNSLEEIKGELNILEENKDIINKRVNLLIFAQLISILLFSIGSFFWYVNLQRYSDYMIKFESGKLKEELLKELKNTLIKESKEKLKG